MINDFEYFAPKTLKEAFALLDKYQDDCKVVEVVPEIWTGC